MPGAYILKTIEANLTRDTELIGKMSPYCMFSSGNAKVVGQTSHKGGKHPFWYDSVTLPVTNDFNVNIEVKDKDSFTHDDIIGNSKLDLREVEAQGKVSKWYPIIYKDKSVGEILIESSFKPDISHLNQAQNFHGGQLIQEQQTGAVYDSHVGMREEQTFSTVHEGQHETYIEQSQVVEPHSFMKSVDVVEIRPYLTQIETLEPHKVLREVQYTKLVPVMKHIETNSPQVVMKEVEVIEPRLVSKDIQVIENVPVKKFVEVIESRTTLKDVDSFEPQTFTKQVEVTEQVPTRKQVTVSEAYTVSKNVDFIEPIITTDTITKEFREPMIIDEKITTTMGPATMVNIGLEGRERTFGERYGEVRISEQERRLEQQQFCEQEDLRQNNIYKQNGGYSSTFKSQSIEERQRHSNPLNQKYKNQ